MAWFWVALAAPALWAAVNHIDKFIISKYFTGKGVGSLVIFTSISGFIISTFILLFNFQSLSVSYKSIAIIAVNGALLIAAYIPYLYALEEEEASMVTALFQVIPVFGYFFALIFLKERLSFMQIMASLLVVFGAIIISLDVSEKIYIKAKPLLLMLLSSSMIAMSVTIFKIIAVEENFWGAAFWEYIGGAIFGLLLFAFIKSYRQQLIATVQKNKKVVMSLNIFSELLNVVAKLLANFASLLAPVALVFVVNGFQPAFAFIYGILLTVFFPRLVSEKVNCKIIVQKVFSIALIFIGVYFLLK